MFCFGGDLVSCRVLTEDCVECVVGETAELLEVVKSAMFDQFWSSLLRIHTMVRVEKMPRAVKSMKSLLQVLSN